MQLVPPFRPARYTTSVHASFTDERATCHSCSINCQQTHQRCQQECLKAAYHGSSPHTLRHTTCNRSPGLALAATAHHTQFHSVHCVVYGDTCTPLNQMPSPFACMRGVIALLMIHKCASPTFNRACKVCDMPTQCNAFTCNPGQHTWMPVPCIKLSESPSPTKQSSYHVPPSHNLASDQPDAGSPPICRCTALPLSHYQHSLTFSSPCTLLFNSPQQHAACSNSAANLTCHRSVVCYTQIKLLMHCKAN